MSNFSRSSAKYAHSFTNLPPNSDKIESPSYLIESKVSQISNISAQSPFLFEREQVFPISRFSFLRAPISQFLRSLFLSQSSLLSPLSLISSFSSLSQNFYFKSSRIPRAQLHPLHEGSLYSSDVMSYQLFSSKLRSPVCSFIFPNVRTIFYLLI
jgi:hypothetical protein